MDKLKIGIMGTGKRAENFIKIYSRLPDVQISGIFGRSENRVREISKKYGIEGSTQIHKFFSLRSDSVCIATLPEFHPEYSIKSLRKGLNVLCEKPIALGLSSAKNVLDAAKKSKKVFMVGFTHRYLEKFVKAKELVSSGKLGKIKSIWFKDGTYYPDRKWMLDDKTSGGVTLEFSINKIDLMRWIVESEAQSVYCQTIRDIYTPEGDHTDIGIIKFENGSIGQFGSSLSLAMPNYSDFGIIGSEKSLVIMNGRIFSQDHYTKPTKIKILSSQLPKISTSKNNALENQLKAFVLAAKGENIDMPTIYDCYKALEISVACLKSARQNKVINV